MRTPQRGTSAQPSTVVSITKVISVAHPLFQQHDLTQLILSYTYDYIPAYIDDREGVNGALSALLYTFAYIPPVLQELHGTAIHIPTTCMSS